jgi:hypothetical protein
MNLQDLSLGNDVKYCGVPQQNFPSSLPQLLKNILFSDDKYLSVPVRPATFTSSYLPSLSLFDGLV